MPKGLRRIQAALVIASLALLFYTGRAEDQRQRLSEGLKQAQLILHVLANAHVSASLEYSGECGPDVLVPDWPRIREPQKPYDGSAADILSSMFSVDGRMAVFQPENGPIRVVEFGVQTDILHVRINHLLFDRISDPEEALGMVVNAPEVQSFMKSHGIAQPLNKYSPPGYLMSRSNTPPNPGVRSISGELNNVTLADALDYILKTFPGFWLYQNCQALDGRVVYFGLFPVPGKMWIWKNGQTLVK